MIDCIFRDETLLNVVRSVTRPIRSIILTSLLALVLVYIFSIIGFIFFQDDFRVTAEPMIQAVAEAVEGYCDAKNSSCQASTHIVEPTTTIGEEEKENSCESLIMCIFTTMNHGLRSGGGIGDVLRPVSQKDRFFVGRVIYDLLFFFLVIIIVLNLIFGVIIDTFADLRSEKTMKEDMLKNSCFICGLERSQFDNRNITFEDHINKEHNMWHYLYFIVLIKTKDPTEFTGPESYVSELIEKKQLDWFPHLRCMSLSLGEAEQEQEDMKALQLQLEQTNSLVDNLAKQLEGLREQMQEQRKNKQKMGLLGNTLQRQGSLNSIPGDGS